MSRDRGNKIMKAKRRTKWGLLGLAWLLALGTGCQTWVAGMTLPSGHYLEHPPQYIPPSPPYPLARELGRQNETAAAVPPGEEALPLPVPGRP
jgi:hypothetical protein